MCAFAANSFPLRTLLALVLFAAVVTSARAQNSLTARLEPAEATIGETVVYVLSVQSVGDEPQAPSLPRLDPAWGLGEPRFVGRSLQTSIQIVNGRQQVTRSTDFRYTLSPTREGTFLIPASSIDIGGATLRANPVTLKVTKVAAALNVPQELLGRVVPPQVPGNAEMQRALTGVIFVLPVVETPTPFAGQQILLTYHLCLDQAALQRSGLGSSLYADRVAPPDLNQFLKEEVFKVPQSLSFREQTIGNRRYLVAPLYQVAITPTKTGTLTAEPFSVNLYINQRGRGGDPFRGMLDDDPFFGMSPFGGGGSRLRIVALSPPVEMDVRPLPAEGRPADFSGAVGDFKLTAGADKSAVTADDDIVKLTVRLEGHGDAAALPKPDFARAGGIRLLEEPKSSTNRRVEGDQLVSTKNFDFLLRATQPGKLSIPPVSLAVFNPRTAKYETLRSAPVALDVAANTRKQEVLIAADTARNTPATGASGTDPAGPAPVNEDIRYIHEGVMRLATPGMLTGDDLLFWLLVAGAPAVTLGAWLAGRRRMAIESDTARYRQAGAGSTARRHLRRAARVLNSGDRTAFFGELDRALRGYFGDKFRIEPSGLTIEQIEASLAGRGAAEETIAAARGVIEECDAARYSPVQPGEDVMRRAYDDAAAVIGRVEALR